MDLQTIVNGKVNGATFVSIDTETVPTIRKTLDTDNGRVPNPHHGRIVKHTHGMNVMVFQNKSVNGYDAMVKRRLEKEGKDPSTFELSDRKWGTRIPETPFVEHKGEVYLEVIVLSPGGTYYTIDGVEIDKRDVLGMSTGNKPEQAGLEDTVVLRTFKAESVKQITIGQETHR